MKKTTAPTPLDWLAIVDTRAEQLLGEDYRRKLAALVAPAWGNSSVETAEQTLSHWRRRAERGKPHGRDISTAKLGQILTVLGAKKIDWAPIK